MTMDSRKDFSELGVILSYKLRANNQEVFKLANDANRREHSVGDICPWGLGWPMSACVWYQRDGGFHG